MTDYQYELTRLHELDYNYMLACRNSLQMKADFCDVHELRMAIAAKDYAKQAYDLQDKVVKFILNTQPGYLAARNAFKDEIEAKIQPFEKRLDQNTLFRKKCSKKQPFRKKCSKKQPFRKRLDQKITINL